MKKLSFYFLIIFISLCLSGCSDKAASTQLGEGRIAIPSYTLKAPRGGKILGLISEKGERISKDQPVFAIEDPELDRRVEQATTELTKLQAELKAMEQGRPDTGGNNLARLQSNYEAAQTKAEKMNRLLAAGAVSRSQAQLAQLELQNAAAALQASSRLSKPATPEELQLQKEKIEQQQQKQQQLLTLQQKNEVLSPCTAIITEKLQKNGNLVKEQQQILVLTAQDTAIITCNKGSAALPDIGAAVTIQVKDSNVSFKGVLSAINEKTFVVTSLNKPEALSQDTAVIIMKNN